MKLSKDRNLIAYLAEVQGYLPPAVLEEILANVDSHLEENGYHVYKHRNTQGKERKGVEL